MLKMIKESIAALIIQRYARRRLAILKKKFIVQTINALKIQVNYIKILKNNLKK